AGHTGAGRCAAPTGAARPVRGCARGSTWRGAGGQSSFPWSLSPEAESRLGLLGFLADDVFAGVLDALALVRLRRAEAADLGGNLAALLPVGAADHGLGLRRGGDGDAFRRRVQHRVREAQRQVQVLALHGGAVTHADQLELAL